MATLDQEVDRLFELPLEEFTAARNDLAGRLKSEGDAAAAEEVKRLTKPSVAAWTINQLSRQRTDAVGALLAAGAKLRETQERALQSKGDAGNALRQAQEDERLRVSRQIHDGPAQTMTNLVLRAEICERMLDMDTTRAKAELSGLKSAVNTTLQETRRFIFDLRPMILDDLGLEPTLRRYVQQFAEDYKIEAGVTINGLNGRLPIPQEVAVFRIGADRLPVELPEGLSPMKLPGGQNTTGLAVE